MIELKHICKTFDSGGGEVEALKDVSLTIEKGEIYGIINPTAEMMNSGMLFFAPLI